MGLASCHEALVKSDQSCVPSKRCGERCGVERASHPAPSASDVAHSFVLAAIIIEGREASKSCCLFAADVAKFGHANDKRERGSLTNAWHALNEIEAAGEIVMGFELSGDARQLSGAAGFQTGDITRDDGPQPLIVDVFETDLEAGDVLFDLFDESELMGEGCKPLIGLWPGLINRGCTGGDDGRIELIVLGAAQMDAAIGFDLDRLEDNNNDAAFA